MTEAASYGKWEVVKPIGRGGQGKVYRLWLAGSAAFVKVLTVVQFWELWHNRWRGDREPECGWESD